MGKDKDVKEEPTSAAPEKVTPAMLIETCKTSLMDSCIAKYSQRMPEILKAEGPLSGDVKKEVKEEPAEEKTEENTEDSSDAQAPPSASADETTQVFDELAMRLAWHNPLGLAEPATATDAITRWFGFKALELDWGPRKKKRETGTPSMDRILQNLNAHFVEYLHLFMAVMMLQAFLFRSWFACLPWLLLYQCVSLRVPLKTLDALPQIPLSKVPMKFRVACTMGIHGLVWLFFLYEAVWRCNFFLEFLALGSILLHAHSVKPNSVPN